MATCPMQSSWAPPAPHVTEIAGMLARGLHERFPTASIVVTHDLRIALRAAIPAGDGIVLVVGTGSGAYAEIGANTFRAGGGGYAFGDEGSGFAVGAAGLRQLRRAMEGRVHSDGLTETIAARTGAHDLDDLGRFAYGGESTVAAVASLAACVLDSADAGERSAMKIVQTAALELFDLVRALCRSAGAEERALPLAFSGGLLRRNSLLTYLIETRVANELPNLGHRQGRRRTVCRRARAGACTAARRSYVSAELPATEGVAARTAGLDLMDTAQLVETLVAEQRGAADAVAAQTRGHRRRRRRNRRANRKRRTPSLRRRGQQRPARRARCSRDAADVRNACRNGLRARRRRPRSARARR